MLTFLFSSCSQDSVDENSSISANSQYKIEKVLDENKENDQRLKYTLLSKDEKYQLWHQKFESLLQGDLILNKENLSLNEKQRALVDELNIKLGPNIFSLGDNGEKEYFRNIYAPKVLKRAEKIFSKNQIIMIFYKLSVPNTDSSLTLKQLEVSIAANSENDCECDSGSIFTCQIANAHNCQKTYKCAASTSGCGFMGLWECDGRCTTQ